MNQIVAIMDCAALVYGAAIVQLGLGFAPNEFWQEFERQHPDKARWLWGFSHPLDAIGKAGDVKPWYR